jgi:hypothetical protein
MGRGWRPLSASQARQRSRVSRLFYLSRFTYHPFDAPNTCSGQAFFSSPIRGCLKRFEDEDADEYQDDWAPGVAIRGGGRSGRRSGAWLGGRRRR